MGNDSDIDLLRRIGRGDAEAFARLVADHARYLYGVAHGLVGRGPDAEDLVQETFLAVLKSRFRGESSLRTWLVAILVRQAAMMRRTRSRRLSPLSLDGAAGSIEPVEPSHESATDARLDLASLLAGLSLEHRAVLMLREIEGLSYDQIAEALDLPRGTVESRLHRARRELRDRAGQSERMERP